MNTISLLLMVVFSFSNQANAFYLGVQKCHRTEWKTAFMELSPAEIEGGEKWALKCYPFLAYNVKNEKFFVTDPITEQVIRVTPVFARVDVNGEIVERLAAPVDPGSGCDETIFVAGFCQAPNMF